MQNKTIQIYTDGACKSNPGPGGWGAVILHPDQLPLTINGGEINTTNNSMELMAVIKALENIQTNNNDIILYTDSKYIQNGITKWITNWKKNNWQSSQDTPVKNQSLWKRLDENAKKQNIQWEWVKGHAGNQWNEKADQLAREAIPKSDSSDSPKNEKLPLEDTNAIHIFTGVAFSTKSKQGTWAAYLRYKNHTKHISGTMENTSSNQMHILSATGGLQLIKKQYHIHMYTLSDYLKDGASIWINNWHRNDWTTKEGTPVKHKDLWIKLQNLTKLYKISWHLVSKQSLPEEITIAKNLAQQCLQKTG